MRRAEPPLTLEDLEELCHHCSLVGRIGSASDVWRTYPEVAARASKLLLPWVQIGGELAGLGLDVERIDRAITTAWLVWTREHRDEEKRRLLKLYTEALELD